MISLVNALASYAQHLKPLPIEHKTLQAALLQVLAEDVYAKVDLPLFDQSAVDGYALCAEDVQQASLQNPVWLPLAGNQAAGEHLHAPFSAGSAVRILTGAMLPVGANTIARQEIIMRDGQRIGFTAPLKIDADLRHRGEELRVGQCIAKAGQRLTTGLLAALAMAGVSQVAVHRKPRIAVLVTGDEVMDVNSALQDGQIYDANGPLVQSWLISHGYTDHTVQWVSDHESSVRTALETALSNADLVITTGGVSVGDRDFIPSVAEQINVQKIFWKVAQKPGKPLWFGVRNQVALLGLPGNPAAVLIGLTLHIQRALEVLEGVKNPAPHWHLGVLSKDLQADERDRLLRVVLDVSNEMDDLNQAQKSSAQHLKILQKQASHMLSNLAFADALAWIPASQEAFKAGQLVRWCRCE